MRRHELCRRGWRLTINSIEGPAPLWVAALLFMAALLAGCTGVDPRAAQQAFAAKYQALFAEENHFTPVTGQAFDPQDWRIWYWEAGHRPQYSECEDLLYCCLGRAKELRQARVAFLLGCFAKQGIITKAVDWLEADIPAAELVRLIEQRGFATSAYYQYRYGGRYPQGTAAAGGLAGGAAPEPSASGPALTNQAREIEQKYRELVAAEERFVPPAGRAHGSDRDPAGAAEAKALAPLAEACQTLLLSYHDFTYAYATEALLQGCYRKYGAAAWGAYLEGLPPPAYGQLVKQGGTAPPAFTATFTRRTRALTRRIKARG